MREAVAAVRFRVIYRYDQANDAVRRNGHVLSLAYRYDALLRLDRVLRPLDKRLLCAG